MTIIVAGGTGTLGTLLVRRLATRGVRVRVLTRDRSRAAHLVQPGVEIITGDLRETRSLAGLAAGVDAIVAAAHGFGDDGSPDSVDRSGNFRLIDDAARFGTPVVLMSVVGAAPDHPLELFRAKHAAEQYLRRSGVPWSIVRASAFIETWARIVGDPLRGGGRALVFGPGINPINFVSAADVAALLEHVIKNPVLRGETIELGGANLSLSDIARIIARHFGKPDRARHVPIPLLRAMGELLRPFKPTLARHARAAVVMNEYDMTFDGAPTRTRFPDLPNTELATALERYAHQR